MLELRNRVGESGISHRHILQTDAFQEPGACNRRVVALKPDQLPQIFYVDLNGKRKKVDTIVFRGI